MWRCSSPDGVTRVLISTQYKGGTGGPSPHQATVETGQSPQVDGSSGSTGVTVSRATALLHDVTLPLRWKPVFAASRASFETSWIRTLRGDSSTAI